MRKLSVPILAVIFFLLTQAAAGVLTRFVLHTDDLSVALLLAGGLTILLLTGLHMADARTAFDMRHIDWRHAFVGIIATLLGIVGLDLAEEMLHLPNLLEETFIGLAATTLGAFSIAVVGPVVEELVFRECVLGHLLRHGMKPWTAIVASALVFGIIHLNPAQIPFAAAVGGLLGILYAKSGSIVPGCIVHIANNSVAVWQMRVLGSQASDYTLTDWMGGLGPSVLCMVASCGLCAVLCVRFWQRYEPRQRACSSVESSE